MIASSSRARSGCFRSLRPQRRAHVFRNVEPGVERAVGQVAQQRFLLLVAGAGHVDERAGVGRDHHADLRRQAQPQGGVVFGVGVLDAADRRRHAIEEAHDAFLHLGRQAGHGAARHARFGARLVPVAGHLHDRPQRHRLMVAEGGQAPEVPAALVVGEVLVGDGDGLAGGRGAAGQREHVDAAVGQQGVQFAAADAGHVRFDIFIAGDGHLTAVVVERG